ncbi:hypothetical protein JCM8547_007686 [Rhodosporidiobolus lusitaniae]
MPPAQGGAGQKRAFTTNWRAQQQRKNKTWENDGYAFVEGQSMTLSDDGGKFFGNKTINKPLTEGCEFTFGTRDFKIIDEIPLADYFAAVSGSTSRTALGTPARATPVPAPRPTGWLARSTGSSAQTPQPAARSAAPPVPVGEDGGTPASTGKKWLHPAQKVQKPFKALLPGSAVKREASVEPSRRASFNTPGLSRLKREVQFPSARSSRKGNEREHVAAEEEDEDEDHGVENTPPSSQNADAPPAAKKRRLDTTTSGSASTYSVPNPPPHAPPPRRTVSAYPSSTGASSRRMPWDDIDAAVSRSIPSKPPPPAMQSSSMQADPALFRTQSSPVQERVKAEPLDDEDELARMELEMEMDAEIFAGTDELAEELGDGSADESRCFEAREVSGRDKRKKLSSRSQENGGKADRKGKGRAVVPDDEDDEETGPSVTQGNGRQCFECQYRKRNPGKKHPVWEGDGILIVTGLEVELRDAETGSRLSSSRISPSKCLDKDEIFDVGLMTIEIGAPIHSNPSYPYNPSSSAPPPPPVARPVFKPPAPALSAAPATGAYKPFRAPGSSRATTPLTVAQIAASVSPPSGKKAAASAVKSTSFFLPGPPITSKNRSGEGSSNGLSKRKPQPRFDPDAKGAVVMQRPNEEHEKTYNKKGLPVVDVVIDPILGDKLREHQKEGVRFMYECVMGMRTAGQGCILADDMGLGKTIQAISLIWTMLKQNPYFGETTGVIQRAMIVCPVTLVKNWSSEIKKWLGKDRLRVMVADTKEKVGSFARSKSYDVLIIGYEKLRSCIDEVKYAQPPVGLVICDEGHRLKSAGAKTTQALQTLSCMRRVILSGTPIQNNLGEFFAMMDFVNPGILKDAAYFKKHFEMPITNGRQPNATTKAKAAGIEAAELLADVQNNFVLRRTNEVNLKHLPPKVDYNLFIVPTSLEIMLYRKVLGGSVVRGILEGQARQGQLSVLDSLRKLANTPGLLMKEAKPDKGCEAIDEEVLEMIPEGLDPGSFSLSAKLSVLGTLLSELRTTTQEKIVVISNFTQTLDIVEAYCKRKKYPMCRLDGKTPQNDRIPMVEGFNKGSHKNNFVFLLSSKAGGTGLNIIGASRLVMLDADWNPSNDAQAMARIHREGQKNVCYLYRFFTAGTIDEKVFQRQITKQALSRSIMGEDTAGAQNKGSNTFSPEELRAIFTIHDDSACETHDLLGCRCHFGEVLPDDDDEEDDEDSDEGGFQQASQWQDGDSEKKTAKNRRNLSVLKTWTHYNCSDAASIDDLDDAILRSLVYQRMTAAPEDEHTLEPQGHGQLLLRAAQVGWVFGKKTGADTAAREERE